MEVKTHTEEPNFTVVLPGGCSAHCDFCTDPMNYKAPRGWLAGLMQAVNNLPNGFTGGEPTQSRYFIAQKGGLKMEVKTHTEEPNFTAVLPGGCSAHCDFCTDPMNYKAPRGWLAGLMQAVNNLPNGFNVVSVTGGEPTQSRYLIDALEVLAYSGKFKRVVLTTYGAKLAEFSKELSGLVSHVNISRHGIGYDENQKIFKSKHTPKDDYLASCIDDLNKDGIKVNFNFVYTSGSDITREYVFDYADYAKHLGADSISFRYDQNENSLSTTHLESSFSDYKSLNIGNCGVCRSETKLIRGIPVVFKASFAEPNKGTTDLYELIYGVNGKLTTDWEGESEYSSAEEENRKFIEYLMPSQSQGAGKTIIATSGGGCGGSTSFGSGGGC